MKKEFDFKLIDKFPGYNSSADKTNLSAGTLIRGSKNVYKTIRGTIATRPGVKKRGSNDTTDAGVKAEYVWNTNVGTTRPIRVSDNKLQVESDIVTSGTYVWYDLLVTSTLLSPASSLTRFVFDTWWDEAEKSDRLIATRGDDKIIHWSGGIALVDSATTNTITKQGAASWSELGFATQIAAEKKIIIDGREFTYTGGEDTTTLTGVTASSGTVESLTSGMVAVQSVFAVSADDVTDYDFDFVKTINNQAWYGSYSSRIVYISADITAGGVLGFLNLVDSTTHVYGDPDNVVLDNQAKGIGVRDGKVIIFAGDSDMYIVTPNQNVTYTYTGGDGLARFNFQKIEKKQLPGMTAALGHEFIDNLGGNLVWLDQKNRLRAIGTFANVDAVNPANLSLPVQTELSEDDFTGGHLKVVGDIEGDTVYITAPNNARDWMYQIRERLDENGQIISEKLWHPPQIRGISRFSVINGVLYGHSNKNPMLFQIWDTDQWFDDDSSGEEIPYVPVARFSYQNHGREEGQIVHDALFIEGYMMEGFDLRSTLYIDYQGANGIRDLVISNDSETATFFSGLDMPNLGDAYLGQNPLGDGIIDEAGEQENVPKFRAIISIPQAKPCFEYSLEFYSLTTDCRWEILTHGTNVRLSSQNADFIKK